MQPAAEDRSVRSSAEQLAELQRLAGIGLWDWHVPSNTTTWSPETYRLFGVDPDSYTADYEGWLACIHPDDREMVVGAVNQAFTNHEGWAFDHRVVRPDGVVVWLHCRGEAQVVDGEVERMVGVSMDITGRVTTKRHLRDFVSSASHELRTPVSSIHQAVELLRRDLVDEAERPRVLDALARQSDRLRRLTTDLLDLSLLDAEPTTVMLRSVKLEPVVTDIVAGLPEDGEVVVDVPADLMVRADPDRLERALVNLVDNALTHGAAPVTVTASGTDDEVTVRVIDEGPGVARELRPDLFTPFVGAHASTGLGLTLARRWVVSMAGRVELEDTPMGACFAVRMSRA